MGVCPVWCAPRPRPQCGAEPEAVGNRNGPTRGESVQPWRRCGGDRPRRSRESHACQIRRWSTGHVGAGREPCALLRTFLIAECQILQVLFSDRHSSVRRFRAAWRTSGEAKRGGSLMAASLREGVAGWRFGTGCPAGRPVGDAGWVRPRLGFRQPGRDGTRRRPVLHTGIRRRRHLPGGQSGLNLMQPPEVRPPLRREIDKRGNRPGVRVLTGPAQDLPHLPAGDGES